MKKIQFLLLLTALLLLSLLCFSSCSDEGETQKLYIYNWGEYIDEELLDLFEVYYEETYGEKIEIVYNTYASNEVMYSKLTGGAAAIDLIIPSDYMVDRLRREGWLRELDFENIPNIDGISIPGYEDKNPAFDPDGKYTVAYTYSTVGLIYDTTKVDPADFEGDVSWRILWDPDYAGNILMFNNSRDAFGIAQYILSYEYEMEHGVPKDFVNSNDPADWQLALDLLLEQKPILQAYVMDEVFNTMESGRAAMAPYYAGDFLTMKEVNDNLELCYPIEGTNLFIDAMCIPKTAENPLAAERFIDFIISTDVEIDGESYNPALMNANYIYYGCPITAVRENDETYIDEETGEECYYYECYGDEYIYPELERTHTFNYLEKDTQQTISDLWDELKIDTHIHPALWITSIVIVVAVVGFLIYVWIVKRHRQRLY